VAAFHLLHWIPDPRLHILNGYNEVIETVAWGLRELGHEASSAVNQGRAGAIPIVFGAQLMQPEALALLPPGSILYNLEQLPGLRATGRSLDSLATAARRLTVWDYSTVNLDVWRELGARDAVHVPIGFAPILSRIAAAATQDIEILIYGAPSDSRLAILTELCARGHTALFVHGLYDQARDALIGRAKIVLCVTSTRESSIFSVVRASYLMANRKAVIGDLAITERDIAGGVVLGARAAIPDICRHFLEHPAERHALEERGHRIIRARDIRGILAPALRPRDVAGGPGSAVRV
jgi:hypothetical protein